MCDYCGFMAEFPTNKGHKDKFGNPCKQKKLKNVSLGHKFSTDILQIMFPAYQQVNDLYPGKNLELSLLYAMLNGASNELGIARNEINGCVDIEHGDKSLILFDETPGGAGHMKKIFDKFEEVLIASLHRVNGDCGCSAEASCYGCLRSYQNQYDHNSLSRGLAKTYIEWLLA